MTELKSKFFSIFLLGLLIANADAITVSEAKLASPLIEAAFPEASRIEKQKTLDEEALPIYVVYQGDTIIGYAFETQDIFPLPAYSGKPVNMLVVMEPEGRFLDVQVLEHHEPILLTGIPEEKLVNFAEQYKGIKLLDKVQVGGSNVAGSIDIDAITGATVTVRVINETIMRSARKVGRALELVGLSRVEDTPPMATVKMDVFQPMTWKELLDNGAISRLQLSREVVDAAFEGRADAATVDVATPEQKEDIFIDLYYGLLSAPTIGKNLLGESQYQWLMEELKPGDQPIVVFGRGLYSFKGSGYVRGGIFDRLHVQQGEKSISFRDTDYHRLSDVFAEGFPKFDEMMIFIIRDQYAFDPGTSWQLELLVRRQVGALDSVFSRFYGDYHIPEHYIERPIQSSSLVAEDDADMEPLWVAIWHDKKFQIIVLIISLILLTTIIFLQDWLVRYPNFLHTLRHIFLVYTVVFIGWYALGQLSVVNVFTFFQAIINDFHWELFLLDPIIFILWAYVAMSLLLWGRGIYCGWLCPFGALQELINVVARKFKVHQFEVPFSVHSRLWALKYIILLALFGISLESLGQAEKYAEVEPFKTAITLKFQREWGFVLYAGILLVASVFMRKVYCRYLCPLGAALVVPAQFRIFDWLQRRKECGQPCQVCANECEIHAIEPNGRINANECHHCLDCQVTYHNQNKCPPLVLKQKKHRKKSATERIIPVIPIG